MGILVNQDLTPLATSVSIDPICVYFNVDEPTFLRVLAYARTTGRGLGARTEEAVVDVGLVDDVERTYPHRTRRRWLPVKLQAFAANRC